jgi:hypothetical protein
MRYADASFAAIAGDDPMPHIDVFGFADAPHPCLASPAGMQNVTSTGIFGCRDEVPLILRAKTS